MNKKEIKELLKQYEYSFNQEIYYSIFSHYKDAIKYYERRLEIEEQLLKLLLNDNEKKDLWDFCIQNCITSTQLLFFNYDKCCKFCNKKPKEILEIVYLNYMDDEEVAYICEKCFLKGCKNEN